MRRVRSNSPTPSNSCARKASGCSRCVCRRRKALRHRQFSQLLRDLRRVRPRRPGVRSGIPPHARAPARAVSRGRQEVMARATLVVVAAVVLIARFSQLDLLWIEEAYPMAAAAGDSARQVPLSGYLVRQAAAVRTRLSAVGCGPGWGLRLAGTLYALIASALLYKFALDRWGRREATIAGSLLAVYLTFGIPSAVMALAPDLLTVVPHIAAVWLAWKGRSFWAGFAAGIAFLCNPKGAFVLAACLVWAWRSWPRPVARIRTAQPGVSRRARGQRCAARLLAAGVGMGRRLRPRYLRRESAARRVEAHRELGRISGGRGRRSALLLLARARSTDAGLGGDRADRCGCRVALLPALLLPAVAAGGVAGRARDRNDESGPWRSLCWPWR